MLSDNHRPQGPEGQEKHDWPMAPVNLSDRQVPNRRHADNERCNRHDAASKDFNNAKSVCQIKTPATLTGRWTAFSVSDSLSKKLMAW